MDIYLRSHINCTDAEGTDVTVDVGECVNICSGWVSGFGGLKVIYTCPICKSLSISLTGHVLIAVLGFVKADKELYMKFNCVVDCVVYNK